MDSREVIARHEASGRRFTAGGVGSFVLDAGAGEPPDEIGQRLLERLALLRHAARVVDGEDHVDRRAARRAGVRAAGEASIGRCGRAHDGWHAFVEPARVGALGGRLRQARAPSGRDAVASIAPRALGATGARARAGRDAGHERDARGARRARGGAGDRRDDVGRHELGIGRDPEHLRATGTACERHSAQTLRAPRSDSSPCLVHHAAVPSRPPAGAPAPRAAVDRDD